MKPILAAKTIDSIALGIPPGQEEGRGNMEEGRGKKHEGTGKLISTSMEARGSGQCATGSWQWALCMVKCPGKFYLRQVGQSWFKVDSEWAKVGSMLHQGGSNLAPSLLQVGYRSAKLMPGWPQIGSKVA